MRPMRRREFLKTSLRAGMAIPAAGLLRPFAAAAAPRVPIGRPMFPVPAQRWRGQSSLAAALQAQGGLGPTPVAARRAPVAAPAPLSRFPDLRRHFIFEYYPWYGTDPFVHWDQWDRVPPSDIAATSVPRLGPYDSRSRAVLAQHARWIAESGAGAVNLSWWGPGTFEDRAAHTVMDVFRDHDLKVTFHLEPYTEDRARRYADDVLYLVREFGERRRFDALLVLRDAGGAEGPIFKGFATILPRETVDCRGITRLVPHYAPDDDWARQTDRIRTTLRGDFDHVTLLADSLAFPRVRTAGFDGIAIYDNFVPPSSYATHAAGASRFDQLFAFNVNPGFDGIEPRQIDPGSCYAPLPFVPPAEGLDFSSPAGRERAALLSAERVRESYAAAMGVQIDPALANARRGFFLVYLNSFNEWHEGHQFEPMKDASELRPDERAFGYHNPERGDYRLDLLGGLLRDAVAPTAKREVA
jgi:hypothetical protein